MRKFVATDSTYLGAYAFGERAREQLRRAEEALELWALHLNAAQVHLCIARDIIAECRYSTGLVEDALNVLSVLRRADAEAVSEREDAANTTFALQIASLQTSAGHCA
jgi:hypothetical protein